MSDRPSGDAIDQHLRRVVAELADLAEPAPDLNDIVLPVMRGQHEANPRVRRTLYALAAGLVLFAGFRLVNRPQADVVIDATADEEQDAVVADDDEPASEDSDELSDGEGAALAADEWSTFVTDAPAEGVQQCLIGWAINRDRVFRIAGDQFNASSSVSEFNVSRVNATAWIERNLSGLEYLAVVGNGDASSDLADAIDEFGVAEQELQGSTDAEFDIAPLLNSMAGRFESIFFNDATCPLRQDGANSALGLGLAAYSQERNDTQRLTSATDCVSGVAMVSAVEAWLESPSASRGGERLSSLARLVLADPGRVGAGVIALAEFWGEADTSPDVGAVDRLAIDARMSLEATHSGCPLLDP